MRRWPRQSRATRVSRTSWRLPMITRSTFAATFSPVSWIVVMTLTSGLEPDGGPRSCRRALLRFRQTVPPEREDGRRPAGTGGRPAHSTLRRLAVLSAIFLHRVCILSRAHAGWHPESHREKRIGGQVARKPCLEAFLATNLAEGGTFGPRQRVPAGLLS